MSDINPFTVFVTMLALGFIPLAAMTVTSYAKLVIVLGLLRNALGVQQIPPNMVMNGIAMILSIYIMAPIGMEIMEKVQHRDFSNKQMQAQNALAVMDAVQAPLRAFLVKHTHDRERQFFLKSAGAIWPKERAEKLANTDFLVLVPSFVVSEVTRAFQIGFLIYLIFVVVDLIIATILLSLGMSMIAPMTVSVPFKLLLFVVMDGWTRLIQGLVLSYH